MVHQSLHREQQLTEALASVANIGVAKIHQVKSDSTPGDSSQPVRMRVLDE